MKKSISSRYGQIEIFDDDLISKFLELYGEWAQLEIDLFCDVFKEKKLKVYDIGAFIGTFSLGVAEKLQGVEILSVEMDVDSFQLLQSNVESKNYHIMIDNVAVSNKSASMFFQKKNGNRGGNVLTANSEDGNNSDVSVTATTTLKNLSEKWFVPDVIKLDVEGHELDILKGSTNWLKALKPHLWLECNENKKALEIVDWLLWMGYEVYYFAFPSFNKNNYNNAKNSTFPIAYEAALIAITSFEISHELLLTNYSKCLFYKIESVGMLRYALYNTPRWGEGKWVNLSPVELLGVLSHTRQGVCYEDFLK